MTAPGVLTEQALQRLPESKRELLRLLAQRQAAARQPAPRGAADVVPATPVQARMWAAEQAAVPHDGAHVGAHGLRLRGALDRDRLGAALQAVVQRHESLRTAVVPGGGGLVQDVAATATVHLEHEDLTGIPPAEQAATVRHRQEEMARSPLRLATGETTRFRLLRCAADDHLLLLASHFAVFDGWSSAVFVHDLAAAYRGEVLPPAPLQAGDVAVWQHRWLGGQDAEAALERVRASLAGAAGPAAGSAGSSTGHAPAAGRAPAAAYRRQYVRTGLDPWATRRGFQLAASEGATPFMSLVAAVSAVVARRRGLERVVIGTPVAGRQFPGADGVVAQLTTVVPVAVDCSGSPSLRTLLGRCREAVAAALACQTVPVDVLLERLRASGLPAPPYTLLLALHNYPDARLDLPGVEVTPVAGPPAHHLALYSPDPAAVTAAIGLVERDGRVSGTAEYNACTTTASEVTSLLDEAGAVLASAAEDAAAPAL